jgi:hypothetical protein
MNLTIFSTCSQIWLSLLVYNGYSTYVIKKILKRKKKKEKIYLLPISINLFLGQDSARGGQIFWWL